MEELAPKGSGPGPHKHAWSDESYYMLDGEITFLVGDEIKTARTGGFVVEMALPTTERVLPPKNASPTMAIFRDKPELLSRYGLAVLPGPDPLRPDGH